VIERERVESITGCRRHEHARYATVGIDIEHIASAEVDHQQPMRGRMEVQPKQRGTRWGHPAHPDRALEAPVLIEHVDLCRACSRGVEPRDVDVTAARFDGNAFGIQRAGRQRGEALDLAAIPCAGVEGDEERSKQE
jgi:hypothetical protein